VNCFAFRLVRAQLRWFHGPPLHRRGTCPIAPFATAHRRQPRLAPASRARFTGSISQPAWWACCLAPCLRGGRGAGTGAGRAGGAAAGGRGARRGAGGGGGPGAGAPGGAGWAYGARGYLAMGAARSGSRWWGSPLALGPGAWPPRPGLPAGHRADPKRFTAQLGAASGGQWRFLRVVGVVICCFWGALQLMQPVSLLYLSEVDASCPSHWEHLDADSFQFECHGPAWSVERLAAARGRLVACVARWGTLVANGCCGMLLVPLDATAARWLRGNKLSVRVLVAGWCCCRPGGRHRLLLPWSLLPICDRSRSRAPRRAVHRLDGE